MKPAEIARLKRIIKLFYGLRREVTDAELSAEIADLKRRRANGSLDYGQEHLAARLGI